MTQLNDDTQARVRKALGYGILGTTTLEFPTDLLVPLTLALAADYTTGQIAGVTALLVRVDGVQTALDALVTDSMATKTDTLTLDWATHYRLLMARGNDLITELADDLKVQIYHNRYIQRTQRPSFRSY